jgi:hypothetical protein
MQLFLFALLSKTSHSFHYAFIQGKNIATSTARRTRTGRAVHIAQPELEVEVVVFDLKLASGRLVSITRLEGRILGISIVSV